MPEEIKLEAVRYLRENALKRNYVSELTGFLYQTLGKWDKEYNEDYQKVIKEELRGVRNLVSEEYIELIVNSARDCIERSRGRKKIGSIKEFMNWLRNNRKQELKNHPFGKSRRVITDILIAHDLYEEKVPKDKYPKYTPRLVRYYPGAQIVLDGKEIEVIVNGIGNKFNLEMSKDIKSSAITSHEISDEETSEVVYLTLNGHIRKHGQPESVLIDNSKANLSEKVEKQLRDKEIIKINAFPWRPETKGTIEGEFSKVTSIIGNIQINGTTEREVARSILEAVMDVYVAMSGQRPHCSVCSLTTNGIKDYVPTDEERENAVKALRKRQQKSEANRRKKAVGIPEEKEVLIRGIIKRNRLEVSDVERFTKTLERYDMKALRQSEEDFYAYSHRDKFEESKRTGQYFVGIVRNKQIEIDRHNKAEVAMKRYLVNEKWRKKREEVKRIQERKKVEEERKKHPEKEVVRWLVDGMRLLKCIGKVPSIFVDKIKKCLKIILSKHDWKKHFERLKIEIMSLDGYELEERLDMIKLASRWIDDSKKMGVKSVTLF